MNSRWIAAIFSVAILFGAGGFFLGKATSPQLAPNRTQQPVIGIASRLGEQYVEAVRVAGGTPVVLPESPDDEVAIADYVTFLDGLLLPGGADIPPSAYGEETHESVNLLTNSRWDFERELATSWLKDTQKPVLGICLGSQLLNVVSGGSLVQDIPTTYGVNHRNTNHDVTLEKGSKLAAIFGGDVFEVNSLHHQAVKEVGEKFVVVARSPEGIPEAIERPGDRFVIGVQWHPEKLAPENDLQKKIFKAFVSATQRN